MLHKALDRTPLTRRIATFEQHHNLLPGVLDPSLHLEQLDLEVSFFLLVILSGNFIFVGKLAGKK